MVTSLKLLVANIQFSVALATSWSQFQTLKTSNRNVLQGHDHFCRNLNQFV